MNVDYHGRVISPKRIQKSQLLFFISGCTYAFWGTVVIPQQIPLLSTYLKNYLFFDSVDIGKFSSAIQLSALFAIAAIVVFSYIPRGKIIFISFGILQRLYTIVLIVGALYLHSHPHMRYEWLVNATVWSVFLGMGMGNIAGPLWLYWMCAVFPGQNRASLFTFRSSLFQFFNIIVLLLVPRILQSTSPENIYLTYALIFSGAMLLGIAEILIYLFVPEPRPTIPFKTPASLGELVRLNIRPLKNKKFILISIVMGIGTAATLAIYPFVTPYISAPDGLNLSPTWVSAFLILVQISYVFIIATWGKIMDRFGPKLAVFYGFLAPFALSFIYFMNDRNAHILVPLMGLIFGLIVPALWEGPAQLYLANTPEADRRSYILWFAIIVSPISAIGPILGGTIFNAVRDHQEFFVFHGKTITPIMVALFVAQILSILSLFLLRMLKTNREVTIGSLFLYRNLMTIGQSIVVAEVEKTLRHVEAKDSALSDTIIARLDDPEPDVREAAAAALGRLPLSRLIPVFEAILKDQHSPLRLAAAKGIAASGNTDVLPLLLTIINTSSSSDNPYNYSLELQTSAIQGLINFNPVDVYLPLQTLIANKKIAPRLACAAARVLSYNSDIPFITLCDIFWHYEHAPNTVLKRQFANALGRRLAPPDFFYQLISCDAESSMKAELMMMQYFKKRIMSNLGLSLSADKLAELLQIYDIITEAWESTAWASSLEQIQRFLTIALNTLSLHKERDLVSIYNANPALQFIDFLLTQRSKNASISSHLDFLLVMSFIIHYHFGAENLASFEHKLVKNLKQIYKRISL